MSKLDINKFYLDDDYILNQYGWNKAVNDEDKVIESGIMGFYCVLGVIPSSLIALNRL